VVTAREVVSRTVPVTFSTTARRLAAGLCTTVPPAARWPLHASRGGTTAVVSPPAGGLIGTPGIVSVDGGGSDARRLPPCLILRRWPLSDSPGASIARPPI
jgi:hypothetical protein